MSNVKRGSLAMGLVAAMLLAGAAGATITTDKSAAIVVYPAVAVGSGIGLDLVGGVDTIIQLSNTSPHQIGVRCFLVNANSHCSNAGASGGGFTAPLVCRTRSDCNGGTITGGLCVPGWTETDFHFHLTGRQPISWVLSEGLPSFPLDGSTRVGPVDNDPNLPAALQGQPATNFDSRIPPAPEIPFVGELKCVQVDVASGQPTQGTDPENNFAGDLIGQATLFFQRSELDQLPAAGGAAFDMLPPIDAASYNAVGFPAVEGANDGDDTLVLGQEYGGCPNILSLNHFFDGAVDPASGGEIFTAVVFAPCSENFLLQSGGRTSTVLQFLVFNEFEQRLSTSRSVSCWAAMLLSGIDTSLPLGVLPYPGLRSLFSVGVQGTLTGQTRIRPVDGTDPLRGDGMLAIAVEIHENYGPAGSAAMNVHTSGQRARPDVIVMPPAQ